ncbi:hypothetical protein SAMN05216349_11763 [Oribacterium sp. KHPX15]|uniref:hypothetical protein n=1 Tax=Oribacterium sp. KHPX15 TaxID=1855342 RepID=UPI00089CE80F|nr:hypothetical protein [Oribacterium sp. KHPX15]SEA57607.1 hypothetical protein SAMN05216349_11763 [Oribacterium sp. KHPX15]
MAVEINDTYGKYVGNNVNPKIIKRGKNSGIRRDTEMGDRAGESVVEVLLNQKDTLEISEQGRTALKEKQAVEDIKSNLSFDTVDDLSKYLYENFNIVKQGMAEISSKYLRDCLTDPDKRQSLFENLKAADEALEEKQGEVGFQSMKIKIDDDGEVTTESTSKSVAVNEQKRRRQIAAAATRGDMQAIIALLEQDLQEVEAGLEENACDEREVEKVKALLSEAKQKMSSLPDREPTPEEQAIMMMNTLM